MNEIGAVLWHSLNESGDIAVYDVKWNSGVIETDIPSILLENANESEDMHEGIDEHGIAGHSIDSAISERVYKKIKARTKRS